MTNLHIKRHPFHLVDQSPWPLLGSIGAFGATLGGVLYFHGFFKGEIILAAGIFQLIFVSFAWWSDIVDEATFQGCHTRKVQYGLRMGMFLFIISEVMFSFSFFWAFFHSSIAPSVEIGCSCRLMVLKLLTRWVYLF